MKYLSLCFHENHTSTSHTCTSLAPPHCRKAAATTKQSTANMRKVTLKLDAICAKLKKKGEDENATESELRKDSLDKELNHSAIRSEETGETISVPAPQNVGMREDLNGTDLQDGYHNHVNDTNVQSRDNTSSFYLNSSFDRDDEVCNRDTPVLDCVESERTSTPKSLSGASKRKSRGGAGLPARRLVPGVTPGDDAEENSNNDQSLSSLSNGTREGLSNGGDLIVAERIVAEEDDIESQGSNANISMQSRPESRLGADNQDLDSNNENDDFEDSVTHSIGNGALDTASFHDDDDESDPWGDSQASQDPWEDDDDDEMDAYPDSEHSDDPQSDHLKAIREYAERSAWDNEETPEIEEGLASNDVITDVEDSSANTSNSKAAATEASSSSSAQDKEHPHAQPHTPVPVLPYSVQSLHNLPPPPSYDAATTHSRIDQKAVKEYATDTMKELLGMYGYEEAGKDIDKQVPLDSFSFRNIFKLEENELTKQRVEALKRYNGRGRPPFSLSRARAVAEAHLKHQLSNEDGKPKDGLVDLSTTTPQMVLSEDGKPMIELPHASSDGHAPIAILPSGQQVSLAGTSSAGPSSGPKTVKQLIQEQSGGEDSDAGSQSQETLPRFSKYEYFMQKLEAGEFTSRDIPNLRVSKYDSYIRKLRAGHSIDKVIGRRTSASQKIRDIISSQIQRKHGNGATDSKPSGIINVGTITGSRNGDDDDEELPMGEEDGEQEQRLPSGNLADKGFKRLSKYTSKYDYFIEQLQGQGAHKFDPEAAAAAAANAAIHAADSDKVKEAKEGATAQDLVTAEYIKSAFGFPPVKIKDEPMTLTNDGNSVTMRLKGKDRNGLPSDMSLCNKYIARYSGATHCGHVHCVYQYKEHYHCIDEGCNFARFTRKEDVIRHYNWHKRRDNSLQHGFMRFSPSDDCANKYPGCTLNLKHTHYHCMQVGCNKVYTSTSDVLTHENFHKKNASLLSDGFQRFRATEDCGTPYCSFLGQKTTHFHCRRPGCEFVFKNKCDIEKHKAYHVKDDIYRKDGFKKFSKHEHCKFPDCKFSKNTNHFHCIRHGCDFVFTAANQMQSHRRKHDRRQRILEYETARKQHKNVGSGFGFRVIKPKPNMLGMDFAEQHAAAAAAMEVAGIQAGRHLVLPGADSTLVRHQAAAAAASALVVPPTVLNIPSVSPTTPGFVTPPSSTPSAHEDSPPTMVPVISKAPSSITTSECSSPPVTSPNSDTLPAGFAKIAQSTPQKEESGENLNDSLNLPVPEYLSPPIQPVQPIKINLRGPTASIVQPAERSPSASSTSSDSAPKSVITAPPSFASSVISRMGIEGKPEEVWQKFLKRFTANDPCNPRCEMLYKDHYHCIVEGCSEIFKFKDGVNRHARFHMLSNEASEQGFRYFPHGESCEEIFKGCAFSPLAHYHCIWSLKPGVFCGEVVHVGSSLMKPHHEKHQKNPDLDSIRDHQPIADSPSSVPVITSPITSPPQMPLNLTAPPTTADTSTGFTKYSADDCKATECPLRSKEHFHCTRTECAFATETMDMMTDHKLNESVIFRSFRQYSRKVDCRRPGCKYNLLNKHFHCLHPGCNFSFLQMQQMESHGRKHMRRIYGKHFNKPGGPTLGPQQMVMPILQQPSQPLNMSPSQAMVVTTQPTLMVSSQPTLVLSSEQAAVVASSGMHLFPTTPSPIVTSSPLTQTLNNNNSKPLPPFLIPLAPLDDEESSAAAAAKTWQAHAAHLQAQQIALTRTLQQQHQQQQQASQQIRKRPLTLVVEDPGAPSGYKRYKRGPLDSAMQERFERYERSEHCGTPNCQYAMNTTHYHCLHPNCGYRFAGKTMMYKHAQHHDRVDSIIQDDFKRFKANQTCDRADCEFSRKNTHFHCLRCPFICLDSGKVPVHRKQHSKADAIAAAGFKQYGSNEACNSESCKYALKYSHFHCMQDGCMAAVIGMAQMDAHSRKYHNI